MALVVNLVAWFHPFLGVKLVINLQILKYDDGVAISYIYVED